MDLVTLTDPALGLNKTVVRIIDIEEDSDGAITATAEEFPQGVATAALYPTQLKSNGVPDSSVVAQPVNTPLILEPPPILTGNVAQLWLGVSGQNGDPNWGGCVVWASFDGNSYAQVARIGSPARQGVVSSLLPAFSGANPDSSNTLAVDLTRSAGERGGERDALLCRRRILKLHDGDADGGQRIQSDRSLSRPRWNRRLGPCRGRAVLSAGFRHSAL
jgi:hypothetical protein